MKHLNGHETKVHSITRTAQGIAFVVRCCDEHEHSVHIGSAHKFVKDRNALLREIMRHQREVSEQHEAHVAIEAFVNEVATKDGCLDCGDESKARKKKL